MNGAHIHLLLNHFPVIGLTFSFILLSLGFVIKNEGLIKSGMLVIFISGVLAVPTYLSGEPAEKVIKESPAFSEELVEAHEEAAEFAIWAIGVTAAIAGAGLYFSFKQNRTPKPLLITIFLLNIFSLAVIGRTNNLGGKISHAEIRN